MWISPGGAQALAGLNTALEELGRLYDVEVFPWAATVRGMDGEPSWQDAADRLRAALTPGCHVVSMGSPAAIVLMALSKQTSVASLAVAGLIPPPATLEALDMPGSADATAATVSGFRIGRGGTYYVLRGSMEGASDAEIERMASRLDEEIDLPFLGEMTRSWMSLNLVAHRPLITCPTLYLIPALPLYEDTAEIFKRFVPHAEIARLDVFSGKLHRAASGKDLTRTLVPFIQRHRGGMVLCTVLFTDIVDSSAVMARLGDRRWGELLAEHNSIARRKLEKFSGREIDSAGDGFFASFGDPRSALDCAFEFSSAARELGLEVRAGLHHGACEAVGDKLSGLTVHAGARIAALAGPGEVLVSEAARDELDGAEEKFEEKGTYELKGIPGQWRLFAVAGEKRPPE
jgi:class 3 adenylate cyclase